MPDIGNDKDQSPANAQLMSAAPNLLAALEDVLSALVDIIHDARPLWNGEVPPDSGIGKARAAIAKARGETL